ncbi:uncharacterized protein (DUF305 family) [Nocardiopsis sp. Huas11]|uniref:DUF305 domain-containing protein n=1 Tax=Nocardiopsis sp. Huas11 TaxID=2183912 RepID=UPI000F108F6D|nr:DUF305 domain-containing protein [Nocardiopsis sp. Huas11]RKS10718.1 uncharacterized protein (DUF305 family) [Nocardiopsis sp. Huas11]
MAFDAGSDSGDHDRGEDTTADEFEEATPPSPARRTVPLWITVVLVALALGAGFLVGRPSAPLDTSADAGFLRDMSSHHAQAVDMSMLILDKTEDPDLSIVATDITRTQQAQIGMMQGWLTMWELNSRGSEPPMTWMASSEHDHGGTDGVPEAMPGLATPEQMAELEEAEGVEAEIRFLELMIAHHRGGIDMAEAEVELGREQTVTDFAQGMADAQLTEIDMMEGMLEDRGVSVEDPADD